MYSRFYFLIIYSVVWRYFVNGFQVPCDPATVSFNDYPHTVTKLTVVSTNPVKLRAEIKVKNTSEIFNVEGYACTDWDATTAATACRSMGCSQASFINKNQYYPTGNNCMYECGGETSMRQCVRITSGLICPTDEITFLANGPDADIWIEGPFSTCTSHVFNSEHVALIGAGIGVIPFTSALYGLTQRVQNHRCRQAKKVDLFWINREIESFSCSHDIIEEIENTQETYLNIMASTRNNSTESTSRYLDIYLYCTSLRSNNKATLDALLYDLAANIYAGMQQHDIHTGLKTSIHVGRPQWKVLFSKFRAEHKSTSVFQTGNTLMASQVKRCCDDLGFDFRHEPDF
ncbi:unnamed protein product [Adineta steineri]|uniref:Ferric reductase NAD binding domain-containing protein n=1 Tax=Adineta steineri TaxID=433720 RepID=A0A813MT58_9BILA|nr:unnamed protein product [Adineta steineri]CAF3665117.1 unnamed protein product [Adineta steineri]